MFDFKQKLAWRLGNPALSVQHGGITTVAISADGLWVAAGFSKGLIMIWELKGGKSIVTILPKETAPARFFNGTPSRFSHAPGSSIACLKFAGNRRRLISVDLSGTALVHSLSSSIVGTSAIAKPLFKNAPNKPSPILCVESLTNTGSKEHHEKAGLLVVVTFHTLTLFRTRPKLEAIAVLERSHLESGMAAQLGLGDFYQHGSSASASWCHLTKEHQFGSSSLLLAVGWGSHLSILRVKILDKLPAEVVKLGHSSCDYSIVEVFWLNPRNIVVLDHRDFMHIFDIENPSAPTTLGSYSSWQPMSTNIQSASCVKEFRIHPSINHSTQAHKGNIYVLGWNAMFLGVPISWLDHVMSLVKDRNPVGAIGLATQYLREGAPFYFCRLPEDTSERAAVIKDQLQELIVASQRVLSERWQEPGSALSAEAAEFVRVCMKACIEMGSLDLLFQEVFDGFKETGLAPPFFVHLQRLLLRPTPTTIDMVDHMPPGVIKEMLAYLRTEPDHVPQLEQVLFRLNPGLLDLNYAIETCRQLNMLDGLMYLWSVAFLDFISPVMEIFAAWSDPDSLPPWTNSWDMGEPTSPTASPESRLSKKLLDFLLDSAAGKSFPNRLPLTSSNAEAARLQLIGLVSAESYIQLPNGTSKLELPSPAFSQARFPYFEFLLDVDAQRFTRVLEKLLHPMPTVQVAQSIAVPCVYLVDSGSAPIELCIFIANSHKSGVVEFDSRPLNRAMDQLLTHTCRDAEGFSLQEAAISTLLSCDSTKDIYPEIHMRLERAGFFKPLYELYQRRRECLNTLKVCFKCPALHVCIFEAIRSIPDDFPPNDQSAVAQLLRDNIEVLVQVDSASTIDVVKTWLGGEHDSICARLADNPDAQFKYMQKLLNPLPEEIIPQTLHLYLDLLCRKDPHNVLPVLMRLQETRGFSSMECIPITKRHAIADATVWLLEQTGDINAAMTEILGVMDRKVRSIAASPANDLNEALRIQSVAEIAIGLCERTHLKYVQASLSSTNETQCEWLYAKLLGSVIEHFKTLGATKESLAQEIFPSLIQAIFSSILRPQASKHHQMVSVPRILSSLISDTSSSSPEYGEFRDIIQGIITNCQTEQNWLQLTSKLQSQDLFRLVSSQYAQRSRGRRGFAPRCLICRGRLLAPPTPATPEVIMFPCGHLAHFACNSGSSRAMPSCPKCRNL
ncbi:Vacuolar protein sorting-associated protein 8 [Entomophthora muscae]|uniref:Vacuolar protein sorting-associated protein 8 n=1 Tax=Entomophthora muscae TaxID=34485 RepID=A0ACC2UEV3_9FUNG|nr:Vacuolar protein sorting-associated protein 8 [Entomophthora muscae]